MSEEQMQREWREEIRANFRELKAQNASMSNRVRALEDERTKCFGFLAAIQLLGVAAVWIFHQFNKTY